MSAVHMARITEKTHLMYYRVFVDRLWPRGIRKEGAPWHEWLPDVAPSVSLRKYYHTHPAEIEDFSLRYRAELAASESQDLKRLLALVADRPVVLLTYSKSVPISHVPVLRSFIMEEMGSS